MYKVLVTAGATVVPIDKVRAITNIFKGRTGAEIAKYFLYKGAYNSEFDVTLLTSNPDQVLLMEVEDKVSWALWGARLHVVSYRTFDELEESMKHLIETENFDLIIHSAAVSDYKVAGVCIKDENKLVEIDSTKKISGSYPEMYLRLTPTTKLVDQIRGWGFAGYLVKFKLQVGISDQELLTIAKDSLVNSDANMIIANCLETAKESAWWMEKSEFPNDLKGCGKISREDIARTILQKFEDYMGIFNHLTEGLTQSEVDKLALVSAGETTELNGGLVITKQIGNCDSCVFKDTKNCARIFADNYNPVICDGVCFKNGSCSGK